MRIAMVSEHASPLAVLGGVDAGGQNVFVASLAAALARRDVEVTVYTRRDSPSLPERAELCPGVTVEHVAAGPASPISKDLLLPHMHSFGRRLWRSWSARRPDLVHAHFWMSGLASLAAARPLELPVVQTFHALGVVKRRHHGRKDTSPPERLELESHVLRDCHRVVATCSDELFELVRLGADRRKISVIPAGVDLDLFRPRGPVRERSQPKPGLHVVVVSRLVERKGIGNLISALARVPGATLSVAGGPERAGLDHDPDVARYRRLACEVGVDDRVHFLGRLDRDEVPALIRSADVVACVPWYEPFGMVALEAMACGVPVVASAVGGLVDTVVDGVTGVHVPPRQPRELARALRRMEAQPALRRRLGELGAARARERYGWDTVAASTLAVHRRLLRAPAALGAAKARP